MELNFDKEIDALLRQTARSGQFVSTDAQTHLDADEISAFAENALPEKARAVYVKHFADCDRCRTILSNLILLNAEAETESASAAVVTPEIVETKTPWYRRIFAVPNLAYTMGGLVLLFGGFFGFLIFQSANNYQSEVSRISDNEPRASGPNIGSGETFYNANSTNLANMANTSVNSAANTSIMMSNTAKTNPTVSTPNANKMLPAPNPEGLAKEKRDDQKQLAEEKNEAKPSADIVKSENPRVAENDIIAQERETAKTQTVPNKPVQAAPPASIVGRSETQEKPRAKKSISRQNTKDDSADENTRQISGKNFNRKDGVWYDAAYRGQSTTNVRRNTENYRKLDSGLRIIAESLAGTVVVVWKEKAFRIQ